MKRFIAVVGILCLASLVAVAQTDVTSVNAVGFVRNAFPTGKWCVVQVPFDELATGQSCITNVLGDSLPDGSVAWLWNRYTQTWRKESYGFDLGQGKNAWSPGTNLLSIGNAVFVYVPSAGSTSSYTVAFNGEVPSTNTIAIYLASGFSLVGYPYPAAMPLTNTVFGTNGKDGDVLWYWNTAQSKWEKESYGFDLGKMAYAWTPGTLVLQPGMGFFYRSVSTATNNAAKPYPWP